MVQDQETHTQWDGNQEDVAVALPALFFMPFRFHFSFIISQPPRSWPCDPLRLLSSFLLFVLLASRSSASLNNPPSDPKTFFFLIFFFFFFSLISISTSFAFVCARRLPHPLSLPRAGPLESVLKVTVISSPFPFFSIPS